MNLSPDEFIPRIVMDNITSIAAALEQVDNPEEGYITIAYTKTVTDESISSMTVPMSEIVGSTSLIVGSSTAGILYPDGVIQVVSWNGDDTITEGRQDGSGPNERRFITAMIAKVLATYPTAYALKNKIDNLPIERVLDVVSGMSLLAHTNSVTPESIVPATLWAVADRPYEEIVWLMKSLQGEVIHVPDVEDIYEITGVIGNSYSGGVE